MSARSIAIAVAGLVLTLVAVRAAVAFPIACDDAAASPDCDQSKPLYAGRTVDEWRSVIKSLELNSPAATQAVPGLIALCRDPAVPPQTRAQAAYTLGRIGEPAVDAVSTLRDLLHATEETDPAETARWAAKGLALFGPLATEATPELAAIAIDDAQPVFTRQVALEALGRIGGEHREAIPVLLQLMAPKADNADTSVERKQIQEAAIDSLSFVGPAAAAAVPQLIRLTRDNNWPIRYRAARTLASVGTAADIAAEALAELVLFDEIPEVRDAAAAALARIGTLGRAALRQLLTDPEVAVRRQVASAFADVERLEDEDRQALLAALDDEHSDVRLRAVTSLLKHKHDPSAVFPVLISALSNVERQPRIRAYRLILDMRRAALPLLPTLTKLANDERPAVRRTVRRLIDELKAID